MLILHKLCFYKEAMLHGFMLISLFFTPSKNDDDLSNRMGGSFWSTFQKVQITNEIEFLYVSFLLSLSYYLCVLYTNYVSAGKQYCMVLCFSVSFMTPQRKKIICGIGWEVRFGQHFKRYREIMSLNFHTLLLCYHYVIIYAYYT